MYNITDILLENAKQWPIAFILWPKGDIEAYKAWFAEASNTEFTYWNNISSNKLAGWNNLQQYISTVIKCNDCYFRSELYIVYNEIIRSGFQHFKYITEKKKRDIGKRIVQLVLNQTQVL